MNTSIRTCLLTSALMLMAPLHAASADGLNIFVESSALRPVVQKAELGRELQAVESQFSAYTGFTVIQLGQVLEQIDIDDPAALAAFGQQLESAIAEYDGREYESYGSNSSPEAWTGLVDALDALSDRADGTLDLATLDRLQEIENQYVSITGFALIGLIQQGRELLASAGRPGSGTESGPKGGTQRHDEPAQMTVDAESFWYDYGSATESFRTNTMNIEHDDEAEAEAEGNPYDEITARLIAIHAAYFGSGGSDDRLVLSLVVENHGQTPSTIASRARIRILGRNPQDLDLDAGGALALQGFQSGRISFSSTPLSAQDRRVVDAIRVAVRDGAEAVIAVQDSAGRTHTARFRLGAAGVAATDEALQDALDAALNGG